MLTTLPQSEILFTHPDLAELNEMAAQVLAERQPVHEALGFIAWQPQTDVEPQKISAHDERKSLVLELDVGDDWIGQEEYSHSMRIQKRVGELAVRGALQTPEGKVAVQTLRERFESSVIEMLHTDPIFRAKLEINRRRDHAIIDGHVMDIDGKTSKFDISKNGAKRAAIDAAADIRMQPLVDRCTADVRVAKREEELPIGGFFVGLSVDPKEAMARYGKKFYEDLGFREGLAFLQWYYRVDEHTIHAATYSVDLSDLDIWREVLAEFGGHIPKGESTNTWLDHDIKGQGTLDDAHTLATSIRQRFYQKKGDTTKRYSVDEFMALNKEACDELFNSLYMNLTVAYATGKMDNVLRVFVKGLLSGGRDLNPAIRDQLISLQLREKLDRVDIALLEQLVRYAVTMRLRTGLALLGTKQIAKVSTFVAPDGMHQAEFIAKRRTDDGNPTRLLD